MTDDATTHAPAPQPRPAGGPGWSVRSPRPRQQDAWGAGVADAPAVPTFQQPTPGAPEVASFRQPSSPPVPRPLTPQTPPPLPPAPQRLPDPVPPAQPAGFPTNRQVAAVGLAAVVVVAGLGVYLFHGRGAVVPALSIPASGAVAVVHDGPAVLAAQSLTGRRAPGRTVTLPGTPAAMVTTADGAKAYLLDSTHGEVIPVDLVKGTAGTPIPAGKLPVDEALSHDGSTLYVTDNLSGAVIPIDTRSDTPGPARTLGQGLASYTPSPTGTTAVITLFNGAGQPGILAFYDTATGAASGVAVGMNTPSNVTFSPDGATVWVTESGVGSEVGVVIPVDVATHRVGAAIPVGHSPDAMAMSRDGRTLVVTNAIDHSLTIIDGVRRTVVGTVPVGAGPSGVEITADGSVAWVADALDRNLVPVDLRSDRAGTPAPLANSPDDLSLSAGGGSAWVLYPSTPATVSFLNSHNGFGRPLHVGNGPNVLVASDSSTAWVANSLSNTVQQIDVYGQSVGPPIRVPLAPGELQLTNDRRTLLVLSFGDGTHPGLLTAIDTGSGRAGSSLGVGVAPGGLTLSPDGATAYIVNHQTNSITTVDLKRWRAGPSLALPCSPTELVITPDGAHLFVACAGSAEVVPVVTADQSVGAPITVAVSPSLVMGNQGKVIFVAADHTLQEIDVATDKVVLTKAESGNIVDLVPTPDDTTLLAAEDTGGDVLLIHAGTLVTNTSISVSSRPEELRLTPDGSRAYVLDGNAQKLFVIDVGAGTVSTSIDVAPNAADVVVPSLR